MAFLALPCTAIPILGWLPTNFFRVFLNPLKFFGVFASRAAKTFLPSHSTALIFDPPMSSPAINFFSIAAGLGFKPRYWAPKAHVLPLDDPAIKYYLT